MAKIKNISVPPSLSAAYKKVITPTRYAPFGENTATINPQVFFPLNKDHRKDLLRRAERSAFWLLKQHEPLLKNRARLEWLHLRKKELMSGIFPTQFWIDAPLISEEISPIRAAAGWRDDDSSGIFAEKHFSILVRTHEINIGEMLEQDRPLWGVVDTQLELSAEKRGNWVWLQASITAIPIPSGSLGRSYSRYYNAGFSNSLYRNDDLNPPAPGWTQTEIKRHWFDCRAGHLAKDIENQDKVRLFIRSQSTQLKYGADQAYAECVLTAESNIYIGRKA